MKKYKIIISCICSTIIIALCTVIIILAIPKEKYLKDFFKTDASIIRKIEIRSAYIDDYKYIIRDINSFYDELSNIKVRKTYSSTYSDDFNIYIFTSEEYYITVSPTSCHKTIVNKGISFKENNDIKNLVYKYINNKI